MVNVPQQQPQQPMQPQVIIVQQKSHTGCLLTILATLLFGWFGLIAAALAYMVKWAWQVNAWGWRVIWRASLATSNASVRLGRAFHERYGWRGWAVVGAVVVVLAIIGNISAALGSH